MKIFAETQRLILREIVPEDAEGFFELDSDPEVHKYLGNKPVKDIQQVKDVIQFVRQQYIDNGIARWAVVYKATNTFMGWAGLKLVKEKTNDHINYHDVGYRLIKKYWGQGIAYESAMASLAYGFDVMKLEKIYAAAHVDNIASNRVLTKAGLQFIETFDYAGDTCNWYQIDKTK
ncbi:MAG: GNAT family N-acetyltransferase [Bacteroidota bacterium]